MSTFMPQITANVLRRAWLGTYHMSSPYGTIASSLSNKPLWRLKGPHSVNSAAGVHLHHAQPSAPHIIGIPYPMTENTVVFL